MTISEPMRTTRSNADPVSPLPPAQLPCRSRIEGLYAIVEPLDATVHTEPFYAATHTSDLRETNWFYLPYGPFPDIESFRTHVRNCTATPDPLFYAILDKHSGEAGGVASLMSIEPLHGSIEIGHIMLGAPLQNNAAGTEGLYLLMSHAMDDLSNRRLEWKCDAMNAPSRSAARRLGFAYEGLFAQHRIVKGRNRDTAWYSILDSEWPALRTCFETWLDPANFDANGRQKTSLSDLTRRVRSA